MKIEVKIMYYGQSLTANECFGLVKSKIENNEIKSEEVEIKSIDTRKKSIIVLCGNNTKDPMRAGNYTNYCFNWLDNDKDKSKTTAYSIFYPKEQPLFVSLKPNPNLDYEGLAKILFEQIISQNGSTRPLKDISESIGNVTFFGHSAGGFVMNELMFHLGSMLKKRNFSDKDINEIYSNVVFVAYSPFALVDAPINSIYVAPIYDSVGSTKLVYDKMIQNKNVISSNPKFDVSSICKFRASSYSSFFKLYETAIRDEDTLYFVDDKSLISTPNLLFFDGLKEDHNLAGVIKYSKEHPHKTSAGRLTTKFLSDVLNYSVSTKRDKFSIIDLYNHVVKPSQPTDEQDSKNKEL